MRVLHLLTDAKTGGGPQVVLTLAAGLGAHGVEPVVAAPAGPMLARIGQAGIETHQLEHGWLNPHVYTELRDLIDRVKPDLVHTHGKGAGLVGRIAGRNAGVPLAHTYHGLHHAKYPEPLRATYLAMERRLGAMTDLLVHVSEAQAWEADALGLHGRLDAVIPNGVDLDGLRQGALDRATARAMFGLHEGAPVLGTIGRLDPVKRTVDLVDVLAAVDRADAVLCVVGEGPEHDAVWRRARSRGLGERVVLAGEVPEAWRVLPAFDLFVSASAVEGCPLTVLEAMALAVPVVATSIPAHQELLPAGQLAPADPVAFAARCDALLRDDRARATAKAAGVLRVRGRHTAQAMAREHARWYAAVAAKVGS